MKVLSIVISMFLFFSILDAAAFQKEIKFRDTKVYITSQKQLGTGSNTLILEIKKNEKAVSDAKVSVKVFMPAMPGMPAMKSITDAQDLGNGKYKAKINLSMGGTWQVHIFITPSVGRKIRVKTSVNI